MDRRIDQIRRTDAIAILAPVMAEKRATGSKLHGWIRGALAWGVAREHLEFNVGRRHRRGAAIGAKGEEAPRGAAVLGGGGGVGSNHGLHGERRAEAVSSEPLAKRVIGRVFPCRRRRGEGRSAGGMQRSQDGSDRARESGDTGVHGACLPVMRASAREERFCISFTSRSSLRLFSIHSR